MHLDEEQIQRLLHGEQPPQTERSAREHMAGCADCRRRLAEAEREEREVHALLRAVDNPPPRIGAEAVAARAAAASERARDSVWLRRAAGIILAAGIAGAAYAVPGSPVRAWVDAIAQKIGGGGSEPSAVAPAPGTSTVGVSGIAVLPGKRLQILFKAPEGGQGGGQVLVCLTVGSEVQVRAPDGAATFTSRADQLLINNRSPSAAARPDTFEIEIPSDAPWVEIRVGGDRIFLKEGPRVTTGGSIGPDGGYVLPLTRPSGP